MNGIKNVIALVATGCCLIPLGACLGKKTIEAPPPPPPAPTGPSEELVQCQIDVQRLEETLARVNEDLDQLRAELEQTREQALTQAGQLEDTEATLAWLEERYAAREIELASTTEEVLRSKASLRGVQSRALATSRIAEVRVQLQSLPKTDDREAVDRARRARELLDQADITLGEGNYGGASYLAERAAELVRQARLVNEFRSTAPDSSSELIPIVPARELEAAVNANLRRGPGTDTARIGGLTKGEKVLAVARLKDWFQVETKDGVTAWLHRRVVR